MKKHLVAALKSTKPLSKPLLLASFGAGYILATLLFTVLGSQIHRLFQSVFY